MPGGVLQKRPQTSHFTGKETPILELLEPLKFDFLSTESLETKILVSLKGIVFLVNFQFVYIAKISPQNSSLCQLFFFYNLLRTITIPKTE